MKFCSATFFGTPCKIKQCVCMIAVESREVYMCGFRYTEGFPPGSVGVLLLDPTPTPPPPPPPPPPSSPLPPPPPPPSGSVGVPKLDPPPFPSIALPDTPPNMVMHAHSHNTKPYMVSVRITVR